VLSVAPHSGQRPSSAGSAEGRGGQGIGGEVRVACGQRCGPDLRESPVVIDARMQRHHGPPSGRLDIDDAADDRLAVVQRQCGVVQPRRELLAAA
jgi:hypothetical protein